MKKMLFGAFGFLVVTLFFLYLFLQGEEVEHNQSISLNVDKKIDTKVNIPIIDSINVVNTGVTNISSNLKVITQIADKLPMRLFGSLKYEKERNFKLELSSFLASELKIGSNKDNFWFWVGRMDKPGLYWSSYDNFTKTRLKNPFNPIWLSRCLGLNKIDYHNAVVDQSGERWRVVEKAVNAHGQSITIVTYIDPKRSLITGHGIYDINNVLEASSEIKEFDNNLPSMITFIWHKENASMVWRFNHTLINTNMSSESWSMPSLKPKIDMSRE